MIAAPPTNTLSDAPFNEQHHASQYFQDILDTEAGSDEDQNYPKLPCSNQQGLFHIFPDRDPTETFRLRQSQPEDLTRLNQFLSNHDASALRTIWNNQLLAQLRWICQHLRQLQPSHQSQLRKLQAFITQRLQPLPLWKTFYPGLQSVLNSLRTALRSTEVMLEVKPIIPLQPKAEGQEKPQEEKEVNEQVKEKGKQQGKGKEQEKGSSGGERGQQEDSFFRHVVSQLQARAVKKGAFYVSDESDPKHGKKKPIGTYIAQKKLFQKNMVHWRVMLFVARAIYRYSLTATTQQDILNEIHSVHSFSRLLLNNHPLAYPSDRLCCAPFLYLRFDLMPLPPSNLLPRPCLSETTSDSDSYPTYTIDEAILDVVALLNRGGGVILLGAQQNYLQVLAMGEYIKQEQMKKKSQKVKQALRSIHPRVSQREVVVSWVPLRKHPYDHGYPITTFSDPHYLEGLYCLRLAVRPSHPHMLYYCQGPQGARTAIWHDGERMDLKGEKIAWQMRSKYQFFGGGGEEEEELLVRKDFREEEHVCVAPEVGVSKSKEGEKKWWREMSLVVVPAKYFKKVEERLWRRGIDCEVSDRFTKYKFKSAVGSGPIWHSVRFDQLLAEATYRKEFQFDGKPMLVIHVTGYLKLASRVNEKHRLPEVDFKNLQKWLEIEFPEEKVEYYIYDSKEKDPNGLALQQHYLRTPNKLSLLFIYYVLQHSNEKAIFKDPPLGAEDQLRLNKY